jgi:hypothetical protein
VEPLAELQGSIRWARAGRTLRTISLSIGRTCATSAPPHPPTSCGPLLRPRSERPGPGNLPRGALSLFRGHAMTQRDLFPIEDAFGATVHLLPSPLSAYAAPGPQTGWSQAAAVRPAAKPGKHRDKDCHSGCPTVPPWWSLALGWPRRVVGLYSCLDCASAPAAGPGPPRQGGPGRRVCPLWRRPRTAAPGRAGHSPPVHRCPEGISCTDFPPERRQDFVQGTSASTIP